VKTGIPTRIFAIMALPAFAFVLLTISTVRNPQKLLSHGESYPMALSPAERPDDGPLLEGLRLGEPLFYGVVQTGSFRFSPPITQDLSCAPPPCVFPNVDISLYPTANKIRVADETPIVANPNNPRQLLAAANDFHCGTAGGMGMYASDDGGTVWRHACMPDFQGGYSGVDPGVAYDLLGGAYASSLEYYNGANVGAIAKSTDNGKTWSGPTVAVSALLGAAGVDKDWLEVDTNRQSPYVNALYIAATQLTTAFNANTETSVSHSNDGGQTWTTVAVDSVQVNPNIDEMTDLAIGDDGTVYVTWLRCTEVSGTYCAGTKATYEMSRSSDGGNTWSAAQAILTTNLAPPIKGVICGYGCLPNTRTSVTNVPVIAIDNSPGPHHGNLYVVYYNWTGGYMQVLVATSTDGGNTWTRTPVASASDTHDQFFPWINVNSAGVIGVSWLDRRNDPNNVNYEAFAAFSTNGGKSFGRNFDLSAKPSNPLNGFLGYFIGDYSGNAWAGTKRFYVTYTDTSTGVDQDFIAGYQRK
jgi:hypothetical protein